MCKQCSAKVSFRWKSNAIYVYACNCYNKLFVSFEFQTHQITSKFHNVQDEFLSLFASRSSSGCCCVYCIVHFTTWNVRLTSARHDWYLHLNDVLRISRYRLEVLHLLQKRFATTESTTNEISIRNFKYLGNTRDILLSISLLWEHSRAHSREVVK